MRNNFKYLNDKDFLNKLFAQRVKFHYAKIILLDFLTENYYKDFVGKVTAGSVTMSATSAVRSTCSLTVIADEEDNDLTNIDGDISVNKKFQLMVGYSNDLEEYQKYGDIVWFPLGSIFVFTGVSISRSSSGTTISVSGSDKMCLLNGDIAGQINSNTTFHEEYTYEDDGSITVTYPTMFKIIQEAVNHFGGEPLVNIVINDLSNEVKQAVQYTGTKPLYYGYDSSQKRILTFNKNECAEVINTYAQNDIVGYQYTDFTYPGELVMDPGSSVADVLNKITEQVGNYEFFYDKYGTFFFQEIKNYLNTSYVPLIEVDNSSYTVNFAESSKSVYSFNDSDLVISYSNTPNYKNIKNDFWVWGVKKADDIETPICFHLAIDSKPQIQSHEVVYYKDKDKNWCVRPKRSADADSVVRQVVPADWRFELYLEALENAELGLANNNYYAELKAYFPQIYDVKNNCFYQEYLDDPEKLIYWLDFVDSDSSVGKFSISNIGKRTLATKVDSISIVYKRDTPDVIILNKADYTDNASGLNKKTMELDLSGQDYVIVSNTITKTLTAASSLTSCYDKVRELLQSNTYFNEQISLNTMPLFFLEPNTRITVNNKQAGINGDFIIQSLTLPLAASGQMTLSASRATSKL